MHGGEIVAQFEARVQAWLDLWRDPSVSASASVLAVTHAGVIRVVAALMLGEPLETTLNWPLNMGALVWLRRDEGAHAGRWHRLHWNV